MSDGDEIGNQVVENPDPSLRSGFRLRAAVALTPAKRLKLPDYQLPITNLCHANHSNRNDIADAALILDFIRRLAEYERAPNAVVATEEDLRRDGFGPEPKFRCVIAEWDHVPAGFAFFFYNYSTWRGQPGLYLEDLFVLPEMRGKGIGKALLKHIAQIALRENCYGIRWMVLEWNEPALKFYERLSAEILGEWETMLLTGNALKKLSES